MTVKNMKMMMGILILTTSIIVLNDGSLLCTVLFFLSILFCVAVGARFSRGTAVERFADSVCGVSVGGIIQTFGAFVCAATVV